MNRQQIQTLISERQADAEVLLHQQRWSLLYYTAGYLVELGLKSCVLTRMWQTGWVFQKQQPGKLTYRTHSFAELVTLADLQAELEQARGLPGPPTPFSRNWAAASEWTEEARYAVWTEQQADRLYRAITDQPDGVLTWLQKYW